MYSRRQALKKVGTAAALATVAPLAACTLSDPTRTLGVALVGLGNYATRQLGPALQQTTLCHLSGIVTGTPEKESVWQDRYGIQAAHTYNYDNFDRIAEDPAIDIVYIVLPNFMHAEFTIRALEAGKHVICEKPMAMNAKEAKTMIAAAERTGKKLQIGYRLYYEPHHLALRDWSLAEDIAGLRLMEASLGFDMARPGMWRIDRAKGGGGALMDLGPYCIQAARRATGSLPVEVSAQAYRDDPELYRDIFGTYCWQLRFTDGSLCNTTASFSAYVDRLQIAKGNNWAALQPAFSAAAELKITASDDEALEDLPAADYQQIAQLDAFANNILQDTPVLASATEGLIDLQIIDAIKIALESGQAVSINYD
ncbi:MAG: Gfo/Idh/MocA family oxidoreductase [Bacteroidota bacterium]